MNKIKKWAPTVLGGQEVETGGGSGYEDCADAVKENTGLEHSGGGQFFNSTLLEKLEEDWTNLVGGYLDVHDPLQS